MMLRGMGDATGYHMDPTGISVPDGTHVVNGALVADNDPMAITAAEQVLGAAAFRKLEIAHIQAAINSGQLNPTQMAYAQNTLAPLVAAVNSAPTYFANSPAYAQQAANAWLSPNAVYPDGSGKTIQQIANYDNGAFDNMMGAYGENPALAAQTAAQQAAYIAAETGVANTIATDVASGTPYYASGVAPPPQYIAANLPKEPTVGVNPTSVATAAANAAGTAASSVLNLSAPSSGTMPNIVGNANGTAPLSQQVVSPVSRTSDFMTELQTAYGPLPLWGWLGVAAVGAVVLMGHKK